MWVVGGGGGKAEAWYWESIPSARAVVEYWAVVTALYTGSGVCTARMVHGCFFFKTFFVHRVVLQCMAAPWVNYSKRIYEEKPSRHLLAKLAKTKGDS